MDKDYLSDQYRETRVMPKYFSFTGAVDIYDGLVLFFSFHEKEVYSIVIESPIVSDMLTKLFKYIWKTLE